METFDTTLLEDVKKYLEYQLKTNARTITGWGGKENLNPFWAGINNSKVIIDSALNDPNLFHYMVNNIDVITKEDPNATTNN